MHEDAVDWLTAIALGTVTVDVHKEEFEKALKPLMVIPGPKGEYQLFVNQEGQPLVAGGNYTVYVTLLPNSKYGMTKITPKQVRGKALTRSEIAQKNQQLVSEADILQKMHRLSVQLDQKQEALGGNPYRHHSFFPEVIDRWVEPQNQRQIVVLGFPDQMTELQTLEPISRLQAGGKQRTDLKSIIWVYGKLLKTLNFVHDHVITNGFIAPSNVLLSTRHHAPIFFDWTKAMEHPRGLLPADERAEVISLTKMMISFVGGTMSGGRVSLPFDEGLLSVGQHQSVEDFFATVLRVVMNASQIHQQLYQLSDQIWPAKPNYLGEMKRDFHIFRTYPTE